MCVCVGAAVDMGVEFLVSVMKKRYLILMIEKDCSIKLVSSCYVRPVQ